MKFLITSIAFFFFNYSNVFSQKGNLIGQISDQNGLPMPGANVVFNDNPYSASSDFDGNFTIMNIKENTYNISVSYIGYKTYVAAIKISENSTTKNNITLEPLTTVLGEVVISSTVSGQTRALAKQKNNINITNVVSADQMAKFPDSNIGESMRRIPGITIQNDQGEARNIIIRGMAPQLNSVTINGERIPSAEAETRSVQMDLIPADMIQTIEVSKVLTSDMDADAIGGSVNLITRAAPTKQRLSATLGSGIATFNNKPLYNAALVYGNRFANDKLGIVISASMNDVEYGSDNVEFEHIQGETENTTELEDYQIRQYFVQRIRKSLSANIDYQLNNNNTLYLKGIYNHRNDFENRFRLRYKDLNEDQYTIERQTKGGSTDTKDTRLEDQRMWNIQFAGEHLLRKLKINWNISTSQASENRPNERYITYRNKDLDISTVNFSAYNTDPRKGYLTTTGNEDTAYDSMKLKEITEENQYTEEKDLNSRLDFELPLSQKSKLKFGARYRSKEKLRDNDYYEYEDLNAKYEYMTSENVSIKDYTNPNFLAGSQYKIGSFATPQFLATLNLKGSDFEESIVYSEFLTGNYNAKEEIMAAYMMYQTKIKDEIELILGLRIEGTHIDYSGFSFDEETEETGTTTGTKNYNNLLPNIQLKYTLTDNSALRAAYTATLARPNYYDLVPYQAINSDDEELELGNINLKAATATNFDVMYESYFQKTGIFSAGIFYKNIENFIYKSTSIIDNTNSEFNGFKVTETLNGSIANVYGIELALQTDLSFISSSEFFSYLNLFTNYTYTKTTTNGIEGRQDNLTLPGTAGNMFNISLGYDNSKFLIKTSANYTTDYIDQYGDFALLDRYYDKQFFLDINSSYNITTNFNVFASVTNLTNQALRYYQGSEDYTMQMEYYGMRINLGLKYNL